MRPRVETPDHEKPAVACLKNAVKAIGYASDLVGVEGTCTFHGVLSNLAAKDRAANTASHSL